MQIIFAIFYLRKNDEILINKRFQISLFLGGITKQTLYRYVSPTGELRQYGKVVLSQN